MIELSGSMNWAAADVGLAVSDTSIARRTHTCAYDLGVVLESGEDGMIDNRVHEADGEGVLERLTQGR